METGPLLYNYFVEPYSLGIRGLSHYDQKTFSFGEQSMVQKRLEQSPRVYQWVQIGIAAALVTPLLNTITRIGMDLLGIKVLAPLPADMWDYSLRRLSDKDVASLAQLIKEDTNVKSLILPNQVFTEAQSALLVDALFENSTLGSININSKGMVGESQKLLHFVATNHGNRNLQNAIRTLKESNGRDFVMDLDSGPEMEQLHYPVLGLLKKYKETLVAIYLTNSPLGTYGEVYNSEEKKIVKAIELFVALLPELKSLILLDLSGSTLPHNQYCVDNPDSEFTTDSGLVVLQNILKLIPETRIEELCLKNITKPFASGRPGQATLTFQSFVNENSNNTSLTRLDLTGTVKKEETIFLSDGIELSFKLVI